jgi:hypothetical protein
MHIHSHTHVYKCLLPPRDFHLLCTRELGTYWSIDLTKCPEYLESFIVWCSGSDHLDAVLYNFKEVITSFPLLLLVTIGELCNRLRAYCYALPFDIHNTHVYKTHIGKVRDTVEEPVV